MRKEGRGGHPKESGDALNRSMLVGSWATLRVILCFYSLYLWIILYSRLTPTGKKIPLRVFMSNESGYYLGFHIYREITDPRTGQVRISRKSYIYLVRRPSLTSSRLLQQGMRQWLVWCQKTGDATVTEFMSTCSSHKLESRSIVESKYQSRTQRSDCYTDMDGLRELMILNNFVLLQLIALLYNWW